MVMRLPIDAVTHSRGLRTLGGARGGLKSEGQQLHIRAVAKGASRVHGRDVWQVSEQRPPVRAPGIRRLARQRRWRLLFSIVLGLERRRASKLDVSVGRHLARVPGQLHHRCGRKPLDRVDQEGGRRGSDPAVLRVRRPEGGSRAVQSSTVVRRLLGSVLAQARAPAAELELHRGGPSGAPRQHRDPADAVA